MLPVPLSVGPISISSFGLFLALGLLFGIFLIWRLARAWDLPEEKILDLSILTFFGGLIFSRLYFVLENWDFFTQDFSKLILITKYPGFSFWGSLFGGFLTLYFFTRRFKMNFLQIADIASIGFLGGLILGTFGCFLGGCGSGVVSNLFFAVNMVGLLGKRLPIQIVESLVFAAVLIRLWPKAIHFHTPGKILSLTLIFLGGIKFILEFLREESRAQGFVFALAFLLVGFLLYLRIDHKVIKGVKMYFAMKFKKSI